MIVVRAALIDDGAASRRADSGSRTLPGHPPTSSLRAQKKEEVVLSHPNIEQRMDFWADS